MSRLTQTMVDRATPADGGGDRLITDGNGLYLRVQPGGTKSWLFRYRRDGRAHKLRLGGTADLALIDARALCAEHRKAVRDGGNPVAERRALRESDVGRMTVREFGPIYMAERINGTSAYKRPEEVQRMLKAYVYPAMGDMVLRTVDKRVASAPLYELVKRGKRVQANRLLAQLKAFFSHAENRGYINASPLASLTAKHVGGKEQHRTRALTPAEVWRVFHVLDDGDTKHAWQTRDALRLVLLTGQRSGEVLGALTRKNLSHDNARWTIPLGFFKSSKHHDTDHVVHLSAQARYVIECAWQRDTDPYRERVFVEACTAAGTPSGDGVATVRGLARAVRSLMEAPARDPKAAVHAHRPVQGGPLAGMKHWTPHDLRRTFATALGELGVMPHIIEKCLNHKLEGILAVYQTGTTMVEREAAMALWGDTLDALLARDTCPDADLAWSDLRVRPSAQVIAHPAMAA